MIVDRSRDIVLGSARASRAVCGALAANADCRKDSQRIPSARVAKCARRGAGRCTRGRVRSPELLHWIAFGAFLLGSLRSFAAEVIPPKPAGYFNDYAGVVSKEAALRLNEQLAQFERETSNQFVVAIFPIFPSNSSIQDFAQRTFQAWKVWQAGKNNGV